MDGIPAAVGDMLDGPDQDLQILLLEFLSKLFGDPTTADVFYSNDLSVIVDTIIRETSDLPPADAHVRPKATAPSPTHDGVGGSPPLTVRWHTLGLGAAERGTASTLNSCGSCIWIACTVFCATRRFRSGHTRRRRLHVCCGRSSTTTATTTARNSLLA